MPSPTSFVILNTIAPPVTGIIIRKLSRAAASRSKPRRRAAVIVIPERDVPGFSASACAAPTITASRTPNSSTLRCPVDRSAHRQQQTEHDERDADDHRRAELLVDPRLEQRTGQRRRHRRQQEQPRQPPFRGGRSVAVDHEPEPVSHVHREVLAEVEDRGEERAEVEGDVERLLDTRPSRSRPTRTATGRAAGARSTRSAGTPRAPGRDRARWRGGSASSAERQSTRRDELVDGMIRGDHGRASSQW